MKRTLVARLGLGMICLALTWRAYTQTPASPLTISKVKEDLYNIEGHGGNVAAYVTSEGVILVDDKFEPDHELILGALKTVTSQPVKYVLTTHHHSDHSGGNVKFMAMATILSTANARANIVNKVQPNAPANLTPANIVFTDETAVFLGGKEVRAKYFGRGHTNGDAVVYFPALKTIHTGDLMSGKTPLIDYTGGGSVVEWTKTLDAAMKMDFDTVIPGHGPVTDKAGLKGYRDNVEKLRATAARMISAGKSQEEVGKAMMAEQGWGKDSLQMQWSLPGMMRELK